MPDLEVITIDGTIIEAEQIQQQDKGLKLQRKPDTQGSSKPETIGFVPYDRLMYVIPEDVTHNVEEFEGLAT